MSFSVKVPESDLEWSGSTLASVFAQKRNLWRPGFWRMLKDLVRFNALATGLALGGAQAQMLQPLGEFLQQHGFSDEFKDWYLLPMLGCIWSCPTDQMLQFPVATMVHFCHNHGLLQITNRPQWHTVQGGAKQYVDCIVAQVADKRLNCPVQLIERDVGALRGGVCITAQGRSDTFDAVVLATHSDTALGLLAKPSAGETQTLGSIRYQPNLAVLHTDTSVLPERRSAWAAWNYERAGNASHPLSGARVCLHYWINQLQPLPFASNVVVSLNPVKPIRESYVLGEYHYTHPVFDAKAIAAQAQLADLQGQNNTWFCGAWAGYGFHEDGLKSGLKAAQLLLAQFHIESPA